MQRGQIVAKPGGQSRVQKPALEVAHGKVHVAHHRALLYLGATSTARAVHVIDGLLDHQLDVGAAPLVVQDAHVLQPHQSLKDLVSLAEDKGASCFLAHTSSLKRLCSFRRDLGYETAPR